MYSFPCMTLIGLVVLKLKCVGVYTFVRVARDLILLMYLFHYAFVNYFMCWVTINL